MFPAERVIVQGGAAWCCSQQVESEDRDVLFDQDCPFVAGAFSTVRWSATRSYVELDEHALSLHFGAAHECVPLAEIAKAE